MNKQYYSLLMITAVALYVSSCKQADDAAAALEAESAKNSATVATAEIEAPKSTMRRDISSDSFAVDSSLLEQDGVNCALPVLISNFEVTNSRGKKLEIEADDVSKDDNGRMDYLSLPFTEQGIYYLTLYLTNALGAESKITYKIYKTTSASKAFTVTLDADNVGYIYIKDLVTAGLVSAKAMDFSDKPKFLDAKGGETYADYAVRDYNKDRSNDLGFMTRGDAVAVVFNVMDSDKKVTSVKVLIAPAAKAAELKAVEARAVEAVAVEARATEAVVVKR